MKTSTMCVDELTLQSVALPMSCDQRDATDGAAAFPIQLTHLDARERKRPFVDDTASEAATVKAEDDEEDDDAAGNPAKISKPAEPATALGFVERMVREYALKREIYALISKKQAQLRHMQALIAAYQEQLLRTIALLDEETAQQAIGQDTLEKETRTQLAEVLTTGAERALVEATRAVGLLLLQRHRILKERTTLRKTAITTRQEECEWLLKSIIAQHERECESLLSAITAKKFLEEGSLQATLAVQITEDDPIFAPVETLYETQPMARQLQLQLDSIEGVISSMKEKCEMLEAKNITPNGPVPLVKRSSFLDRRQDAGFPTTDRKRVVRLCLLEGKHIRSDRTSVDLAARHKRYTSVLDSLDRMLSDVRTRSGRLLLQFIEKLHDDTTTAVRVTTSCFREHDSQSNQSDHIDDSLVGPNGVIDLVQQRFMMARLSSLVDARLRNYIDNATTATSVEGSAVDTLKLPPPAMITAFAKFLTRVITTEYELLSASPSPVDENDETAHANLDDQSFEDAMDQTVLQDCVHEMVFRRITNITYASAVDEYNFARQDDFEGGPAKFLFPWHWQHSKAMLQQLSPAELAFPEDTMLAVTAYLERHTSDVRQNGFLPKTLSLFRAAERETTPKGVVRAVMAGFKMLHREIVNVLSTESASAPSDGAQRRRPQRRGSSFLNADILIPTLVLMMSRLPQADYLDRLWHRTLLVEAFRSSALTDGGEEAYYLTCMSAAMEFMNTFLPSNVATGPETAQECATCEHLRSAIEHCGVIIEPVDPSKVAPVVAAVSSPATTQGRPKLSRTTQIVGAWSKKEHESIKQLSKWISEQPPTESLVTTDAERFVAPHELWWRDATMSM